jgi:hypothetical protein
MKFMINFFDTLYSSIIDRNPVISKLRFYSFLRFSVRLCANFVLPIYFFLTSKNKSYCLTSTGHVGQRYIVSLTSFPARINRLWLVIESILRQTNKPDKIILWLSNEQFSGLGSLPGNLKEIRFCDGDLRSHKKYFYAMKEFPEDIIITIDDDIFYKSKMIKDLSDYNNRYPNTVISQYCKRITWKNNIIESYKNWPPLKNESSPSVNLFFGTGGGTLFPPYSLDYHVLITELFMNLTPTADDVWLNAMCRLHKTPIKNIQLYPGLLPVTNSSDVMLYESNNWMNQNDVQIQAVKNFFEKEININPFECLNIH